jgi:hypothetical protein
LSSIDPRQVAFRAAEEARRRAAEEARRRAAERAREEAQARELGQQLTSALESRQSSDPRQVARILGEAEALGPEARERFLEEAGSRGGRVASERPHAGRAEALRGRIAEAYPEGSDGRRRLGEALADVRGDDPRGRSRESLESVVSETLSRLGATAAAPPPVRSVGETTRDVLEHAPDVSLFGRGFRAAGGMTLEADAESGTSVGEWRGEALRSQQARPRVPADRAGPVITRDSAVRADGVAAASIHRRRGHTTSFNRHDFTRLAGGDAHGAPAAAFGGPAARAPAPCGDRSGASGRRGPRP